jgi:hypothetical protein
MRSGSFFGLQMDADGRRSETRRKTVVCLGISLVLLVTGVTIHRKSLEHARDLFELRTVVDEYCFDKHMAPGALWELVDTGYLRKGRLDSVTGKVAMACAGNLYAEF